MKIRGGIFICFSLIRLFFPGVLCSPSSKDEGGSQPWPLSEVQTSEKPPGFLLSLDREISQGSLPTLFKMLSGPHRQRLEGDIARPQPDSRALRYMKKLYKMFATKEGIPKANKSHLYNTVRLFTPHAECKHPANGDIHSVDLLFNLDRVTTLEHLLKSVLLYSVDKSSSESSVMTCTCILAAQEHDASSQVCPSVPHTVAFNLHFERRDKWVEVDVTTLLQPLMASNKRNIQMAVNFTCLKNEQSPNSKQDSFNMVLGSPSLLLYLNDTSEQAYHRWNFLKHRGRNLAWSSLKNSPFTNPRKEARKGLKQRKNAPRHRRDENGKIQNTPVPVYDLSQYYKQFLFPQNECELHNFWLKFSQLKWDEWIIAPHRYNPHYCKGDCPRVVGHRYGSPVHAMVQNIIYEKLDSSVPRPSCIPAEYSPLSVLKVEADRSIVYKEYEDMIATKCTCR